MSFIKNFFTVILFQPLYNALIILYLLWPDMGVAIILLTVIIRLLLLPMSRKSIESQKKMQEIQPQLKKIQAKYKHDRQLQSQKVMGFYKQNKINPAAGCLPLIVQLIILIALYRVFLLGVDHQVSQELLYGFVPIPESVSPIGFSFLDLSIPSIPLAIIAAVLQFIQGKMMMLKSNLQKKEVKDKKKDEPDFSTMMQQQMIYMGPIITLIIGIKFPSGLLVYWVTTTIFMIVQQYFIIKKEGDSFGGIIKKTFSFKS